MKNNKLKSAFAWVILSLCSTFSFHLYAQPCVYAYTGYYCISEGSVGLIGPANTTFVDLGNAVTVSVTPAPTDDTNETVTYYNNTSNDNTPGCPPDISIGGTPPGYGVTWTASEGSWSTNGTGLTANFTPPTCGGGSVSFVCNYTNQYPCTNTGSSGSGCNFTVVSLNITDGSGNGISSANNNIVAIVGQNITLTAETCGGTFSNYEWTVAGTTESGFYVSAPPTHSGYTGDGWTNGYPLNLTNTTNPSVSFFWIDAGSKSVSCSAVCGGITFSTNVAFTVVRPDGKITATTGSIAISNTFGQLEIDYGDNSGVPGILFSNHINMPGGNYNGGNTNYLIEWVQTTVPKYSETAYSTNHTKMESGLDGTFPYPESVPQVTTFDNPGMGLTDPGESDALVTQTATMWLMFEPSGGQFVPLRKVSWNWGANALLEGGGWTLISESNGANPSDSDTGTTYPTWTDNAADTNSFQWSPPF